MDEVIRLFVLPVRALFFSHSNLAVGERSGRSTMSTAGGSPFVDLVARAISPLSVSLLKRAIRLYDVEVLVDDAYVHRDLIPQLRHPFHILYPCYSLFIRPFIVEHSQSGVYALLC